MTTSATTVMSSATWWAVMAFAVLGLRVLGAIAVGARWVPAWSVPLLERAQRRRERTRDARARWVDIHRERVGRVVRSWSRRPSGVSPHRPRRGGRAGGRRGA